MAGVDYSKWKDIEVSDDEDDTHPNVDTPSLFRWRHQARLERMAQSKQERDEIELSKTDARRKQHELAERLATVDLHDDERARLEAQTAELKRQEDEWREKEEQLAQAERVSPWNIDTISHDKWSRSRINKNAGASKPAKDDEVETKEMREFFDKQSARIKQFAGLRGWDESERLLLDHPELCCENAANYITLDCLNAAIEEKDAAVEQLGHQCVVLQYLLELAKQLGANPQAPNMISNFFKKIKQADEMYMSMFYKEVEAFKLRIRRRAKQKRDEAIREYEEEERRKRVAESPGGLDPVEVFQSLPKAMQDAFDSREVSALQSVASGMSNAEFKYHLKRCIDSGLWLPDANKKPGDVDDDADVYEDVDESKDSPSDEETQMRKRMGY